MSMEHGDIVLRFTNSRLSQLESHGPPNFGIIIDGPIVTWG
jgi:hypothetical protein